MMPAAMICATASPALRMSSKLAMMQRATSGFGTSLTVTSLITASMPSLPTTSASRSSPAAVQRLGAELHRLALDREAAHAQHVVQRQPVLQAVHAAGVLGHVAADAAGDLAARVGRVVQPQRCRGLADGQVAHAALHDGGARQLVQLEDLVELGQRQRHAQRVRQRAAGQAGAGAARHHRHPQRMAGAQHRSHLRLGFGQRHQQRLLAVGGEAVAFIGHRVLAAPQQRMRRQQRLQRGQHLGLARGAGGRRLREHCRKWRVHRGGPGRALIDLMSATVARRCGQPAGCGLVRGW